MSNIKEWAKKPLNNIVIIFALGMLFMAGGFATIVADNSRHAISLCEQNNALRTDLNARGDTFNQAIVIIDNSPLDKSSNKIQSQTGLIKEIPLIDCKKYYKTYQLIK